MGVINRLEEFHSYLKSNGYGGRNKFEIEIGKKPGYLTGAIAKDTSIGSDVILVICDKFPELNLEWLITGKGEMLKSATNTPSVKAEMGDPLNKILDDTSSFYERMIDKKDKRIEELVLLIGQLQQEVKTLRQDKKIAHEMDDVLNVAEKLKPTGTEGQ